MRLYNKTWNGDSAMDKNEILNAAQKNNNGKEYENKAEVKSNILSAFAALVVGAILFFFEYLKAGSFNWGIAAIVLTACATQSLYEGIKLKRLLWIVIGAIEAILALVTFVAAIVKLTR